MNRIINLIKYHLKPCSDNQCCSTFPVEHCMDSKWYCIKRKGHFGEHCNIWRTIKWR